MWLVGKACIKLSSEPHSQPTTEQATVLGSHIPGQPATTTTLCSFRCFLHSVPFTLVPLSYFFLILFLALCTFLVVPVALLLSLCFFYSVPFTVTLFPFFVFWSWRYNLANHQPATSPGGQIKAWLANRMPPSQSTSQPESQQAIAKQRQTNQQFGTAAGGCRHARKQGKLQRRPLCKNFLGWLFLIPNFCKLFFLNNTVFKFKKKYLHIFKYKKKNI